MDSCKTEVKSDSLISSDNKTEVLDRLSKYCGKHNAA